MNDPTATNGADPRASGESGTGAATGPTRRALTPAKLVRGARRVALVGALLGAFYLFSRYSLLDLPERGCSPLWNVAPGDRLVLDTWERDPAPGDGVVVRDADGALQLGRVLEPPTGTTDGALWIGYDDPNCPGYDSAVSGAIARDDVVGRILLVL